MTVDRLQTLVEVLDASQTIRELIQKVRDRKEPSGPNIVDVLLERVQASFVHAEKDLGTLVDAELKTVADRLK
jgi:hypothetical protein